MAGNGMKGMVIEEGERVVQQIGVRINMEETRITALQAIIAALQASWHGPDSQMMIERLEQAVQLDQQLIQVLEGKKAQLQKDIQEQEATSSS
ncbi:hypothetical protein GCM10011490_13140 [Pseudoclavibacter endophyticus]|uniref:Uncharacterized protein n=1 Tax=Pseudoclavibacter endophyticus TaxID=1778590 RepID=A0A6H9WSJ6_9MICO|nr:hypothetical protein [Pseudoclavibacter endophyticus]KAB1649280.1 hypothetical protein F8O04_03125 [Pseudoclavibacter endophyticus]GGA63886.1 hypothetical protein GCM10011490_13140 [Pseudoclavibacter endophyticus]